MQTYKIQIDLSGSAFNSGGRPHEGPEIAAILSRLSDTIREDWKAPEWTQLHDSNGNIVGSARRAVDFI
jgi:hypothetical protein